MLHIINMTLKHRVSIVAALSLALCLCTFLWQGSKKDALEPELTPRAVPIAAGADSRFAIETDGTLVAWGEGLDLFAAPGSSYSQRRKIFDGALSVWAGRFGVLVLDKSFTLWVPGDPFAGQAGSDGLAHRDGWTGILTDVNMASPGLWHGVALKNDGSVWTWGYNTEGQLGTGAVSRERVPFLPYKVMEGAVWVWASDLTTFVATGEGKLYGWGGPLGPAPLPLTGRVCSVNQGYGGYCQVLTDTGELYLYDALSDGAEFPEQPVRTDVKAVFPGAFQIGNGSHFLWARISSDSEYSAVQLDAAVEMSCVSTVNAANHLLLLRDGTLAAASVDQGRSSVELLPQ